MNIYIYYQPWFAGLLKKAGPAMVNGYVTRMIVEKTTERVTTNIEYYLLGFTSQILEKTRELSGKQ